MQNETTQPQANANDVVLEVTQKQLNAMLVQYNMHRGWMNSFTKESENYRVEGACRGMQILFEIMGVEFEKTPGVIDSIKNAGK